MTFVDITIVPVAESSKDTYLEFSRRMAQVFCDHGATRVADHWQAGTAAPDDFHADGAGYEEGGLRSIAELAGASSSEAVVVSVMEWPSREARDRGVAAASADPRVTATLDEPAVFDGSRVAGDSFEVTMDLRAEG